MSHLYSMFAKQVQTFCKTTTSELSKAQCKRDLLMYGLGKLNDMNEQHLDTMDPYQRGAHSLSEYLITVFNYFKQLKTSLLKNC